MKTLRLRFTIGAAVLLGTAAQARAEAMPMMEFYAKIEQWGSEKKEPPPLTYTVEGRVNLVSSEWLSFQNCKHCKTNVVFHLKTEFPERRSKSSNIEVTGKAHRDARTGGYTFDVLSVREVAGDIEKYHELRRKLRQQPAEKWYELGRWAKTRGEFYEDHRLLERSDEAFREGFELERRELGKDNPEGLLKLVDKAQRLQLPLSLQGELAHEAFHLLCARSGKLTIPALQELAQRMTQYLRGCDEPPLTSLRADLIKEYK